MIKLKDILESRLVEGIKLPMDAYIDLGLSGKTAKLYHTEDQADNSYAVVKFTGRPGMGALLSIWRLPPRAIPRMESPYGSNIRIRLWIDIDLLGDSKSTYDSPIRDSINWESDSPDNLGPYPDSGQSGTYYNRALTELIKQRVAQWVAAHPEDTSVPAVKPPTTRTDFK